MCCLDVLCVARYKLPLPFPYQIVALPYLHNTISPVIDAIYTDKKLCELDCDQLRPNNK